MHRENGTGLDLSSHFSLTVSGLCQHGMVRTLLRGKGKHINRVQSRLNVRSFGLKKDTGHFVVASETGAVYRRIALWDCFEGKI